MIVLLNQPPLQPWQQQQFRVAQLCATKNAQVQVRNYCFDSLAIRLQSKDLKTPYPKNRIPGLQG